MDGAVVVYENTSNQVTPLVKISIQGVNYFAAYLGFWQTFSKYYTMKIYSDGIRSRTRNDTKNVYLEMVINAKKVLRYQTNVPNQDVLFSIFNSCQLSDSIRAPAKKAIGCFTIWPNDTNIIYSTTDNSIDNNEGGILIGASANGELKEFAVPEIKTGPIVNILVSELVQEIGKAVKAKALYMCFVPYRSGMHIAGVNAANSEVSFKDYGCVDEPFDIPPVNEVIQDPGLQAIMELMSKFNPSNECTTVAIPGVPGGLSLPSIQPYTQIHQIQVDDRSKHTIMIPIKHIKNLTKLKHCSLDPDFLSVYYEPKDALIFKGNIGNFGKHYIYIKNMPKSTPSPTTT